MPRDPKKRAAQKNPKLRALNSTDEELDRAAEITEEDTAMLLRRAPASVRDYLQAEPAEDADR